MSQAFDTTNIHTVIGKLQHTNIPGTIIKFITNYFKERKVYTTYRNHTFKQHQFKIGVPQIGVLSPTLFNIYRAYLPPHIAPIHVMVYADDITITSTHTSTSAAKKYIQPYLHEVFAWTKRNNPTLNPDIHNISVHVHKPLQIIKTLTVTGCGKQKETFMATYKAVMIPAPSMPLPYGRLLHPRPALTNCKSCRTQHYELQQDAHKTQTSNICMTKHSHFPYTSTYSSTPHNTTENTTFITSLTQTNTIL